LWDPKIIWHELKCHVIIQHFLFWVMESWIFFSWHVLPKIYAMNFIYLFKLLTKGFGTIYMFVYGICKWWSIYIHITFINASIHQGLNPWKCIILLITKSIQNFHKIKDFFFIVLCSPSKNLWNSHFNISFLFQNLFKCYKWKHDIEVHSIMYS
jgi:hypothetical protein